jgi:probable F420-dependent oxidoreductase
MDVATAAGAPPRRQIRIALSIQPQHADYVDIRRAVLAAEECGADLITVWDHFFPLSGDPDGKHFECWTLLAACAEITGRVELAPLVTPVGYRNPDLVADMARTVDHISGGRLVLGLGSGWFERDYREYGFEFGTAGGRLADLEAAIPRVLRRWDRLNPPPPIRIGILRTGGGETKTLRYTARHADIWHCIADPEDLARKAAVLERWCATEGRDPSQIERSTVAADTARGSTPSRSPGPDALSETVLGAGFTLFNVRAGGPRYDLGPLRDWIAWREEQNAIRSP